MFRTMAFQGRRKELKNLGRRSWKAIVQQKDSPRPADRRIWPLWNAELVSSDAKDPITLPEKDIITTEADGRVKVATRWGSFPWERFAIACGLVSLVWIVALPQAVAWLPMADDLFASDYWPLIRFGGAPVFLLVYFLGTFHGFHVPGDSFSYFLTFAFHRFEIEADSAYVAIRKYWLFRRSTKKIATSSVRSFAIDDGWFVCNTFAGRIVICDGPPKSVIKEPIDALNRVVEKET